MNAIRHTTLLLTLAAVLALPTLAKAEEAAPAASAAEPAAAAPEPSAPMPMPGMGMGMGMGPGMGPGMGMRHGAMHDDHCRQQPAGRMGDGKPCMVGQHQNCRMGDGAGMTDKRLDMLEKRMDMMQMMMQMMLKQQLSDTNP